MEIKGVPAHAWRLTLPIVAACDSIKADQLGLCIPFGHQSAHNRGSGELCQSWIVELKLV